MTFESIPFENLWIKRARVHDASVRDAALLFERLPSPSKLYEIALLLKAVTFIDLTTLAGDDTSTNVTQLCIKAAHPLGQDILDNLGGKDHRSFVNDLTTAAVCVYPSRAKDAVSFFQKYKSRALPVACVATGFPSGQYPLSTRLAEITECLNNGATEIDIVIDRSLVLAGKWETLYEEIKQCRETIGQRAHMKTILSVGELDTLENVYKASMVAMMAGSDFIKTSTGKESVNATLQFGLVMCRAIREFHRLTGRKVGLKPAGGLKTPNDAISWINLVRMELGTGWLTPQLFRIGASSLLDSIEKRLSGLSKEISVLG